MRKCQGWEKGRGWTLGQVARRFPTPTAWDSRSTMQLDESEATYTSTGLRRRKRDDGNTSNVGLSGQFTGELNPLWVEWLMGFPPGWTDCELSETPSSQKWHEPSALRSLNGGGPVEG